MKSFFLTSLISISLIIFYGCSKSSSTTTTSSSQWTLKGVKYTGLATVYDTSSSLGTLTSADAAGHFVSVTFYTHPTSSSSFTETDGSIVNSIDCLIDVYDGTNIFSSTGVTGDKVNLTISGGKLTASFTNVTVLYNSTSSTVSGTVSQK